MDRTMHLARGNWEPRVWARLSRLIAENAFQNRYACFDFDDTTSMHAVDSSLLAYQLHQLHFVLEPEEFAAALAAGLPDLGREIGRSEEGEGVCARQVIADLHADYAWLWHNCVRTGMEPERARRTMEHRDFTARLWWLRQALDRTFPMEISDPWCVYLLAGFTPEELYALGRESLLRHLAAPHYGMQTYTTPPGRRGESGTLSVTVETGVTFPPEMGDLYRVLQANGIAVYLISASPADLVRAASDVLGFGIPEARIFAMRLRRDGAGRYRSQYDWDWLEPGRYVLTCGPGKAEAIRRFIVPRHGGRGPLLVGGDGDNDMEMMTAWMPCGDTQAGLILNHLRDPQRHPRLYASAREAIQKPDSLFLLQGLDKRRGQLRPAQATIGLDGGLVLLLKKG